MKVVQIEPPQQSELYNPTELITLAAGESTTLQFRPKGGQRFGVQRVLTGAKNPENITLKGEFNEEYTAFHPVQALALNRLFHFRELAYPFIINEGNKMDLLVSNIGSTQQELSIEMVGVDGPYLNALDAAYKEHNIKPPVTKLLTESTTVNAQVIDHPVPVRLRNYDLQFNRFAISSDHEDDLRLTLQEKNDNIKSNLFVDQINREFASFRNTVPFTLNSNIPLKWLVSNRHQTEQATFSFVAEAYKV